MRTASSIALLILMSFGATTMAADPTPEEQAANTAKAIAEARKAEAEAQLAVLKARYGTDVTAPYTGAVTAAAGSGTLEAYLLATDAMKQAAKLIAADVKSANPGKLVVVSASEIPSFNNLISYTAGKSIFDAAYKDAEEASGKSPAPAPLRVGPLGAPLVPLLGVGLDAFNKLLGFFKSEYSIGNVEVAIDDAQLIVAVAAELRATTTYVPIQYNRPALSSAKSSIVTSLTELHTKRANAQRSAAARDAALADLTEALKTATGAEKTRLEGVAKTQKEIGEKWKSVLALYDSLFGKLGTADEKGNVPIVAVIKESMIDDALTCSAAATCTTNLLVLKAQKAGGSQYTKKNLWTSLGAMPFYVAGGMIATYTLFGADGSVKAAGVVPIHGGYKRIDKIEEAFKAPDSK